MVRFFSISNGLKCDLISLCMSVCAYCFFQYSHTERIAVTFSYSDGLINSTLELSPYVLATEARIQTQLFATSSLHVEAHQCLRTDAAL